MPKTPTRKGVVDGQALAAAAGTVTTRPTHDWEAIERAYRAGMLSVREIAKQHGLNDKAIRKRAIRDGWSRDLTAKVQEAVRIALVRTEVRTTDARTERDIINEAAVGPVQAVKLHRRDVRRAQGIADTLMGQLEHAIGGRDELEELIHQDTAAADTGEGAERVRAQTRRNAMLKAVALPAHVAALRDLGTALSKFIPLERQAFNISGAVDEPPLADTVSEADQDEALLAFAARLAQINAKNASE